MCVDCILVVGGNSRKLQSTAYIWAFAGLQSHYHSRYGDYDESRAKLDPAAMRQEIRVKVGQHHSPDNSRKNHRN